MSDVNPTPETAIYENENAINENENKRNVKPTGKEQLKISELSRFKPIKPVILKILSIDAIRG